MVHLKFSSLTLARRARRRSSTKRGLSSAPTNTAPVRSSVLGPSVALEVASWRRTGARTNRAPCARRDRAAPAARGEWRCPLRAARDRSADWKRRRARRSPDGRRGCARRSAARGTRPRPRSALIRTCPTMACDRPVAPSATSPAASPIARTWSSRSAAGLGEDEPLSDSLEQRHAELLLERHHLATQRRLRLLELTGGGGKRALERRDQERARLVPVEVDGFPVHAFMHIETAILVTISYSMLRMCTIQLAMEHGRRSVPTPSRFWDRRAAELRQEAGTGRERLRANAPARARSPHAERSRARARLRDGHDRAQARRERAGDPRPRTIRRK